MISFSVMQRWLDRVPQGAAVRRSRGVAARDSNTFRREYDVPEPQPFGKARN